jgi:hypothetical protein
MHWSDRGSDLLSLMFTDLQMLKESVVNFAVMLFSNLPSITNTLGILNLYQ